MISQLFSTPLGTYHYDVTDKLRSDVLETSKKDFYNLWNDVSLSNDIHKLKSIIEYNCVDYVKQQFENYMKFSRPVNVEGKINVQYPGDYFPLHSHSHCHIASVYYLIVPENSGDLLLVDPRGDTNWNDRVDGKYSNLSYERIKPKEGMLVFFPGYLSHMTEPNKSDKIRVSVITNFYLSRK